MFICVSYSLYIYLTMFIYRCQFRKERFWIQIRSIQMLYDILPEYTIKLCVWCWTVFLRWEQTRKPYSPTKTVLLWLVLLFTCKYYSPTFLQKPCCCGLCSCLPVSISPTKTALMWFVFLFTCKYYSPTFLQKPLLCGLYSCLPVSVSPSKTALMWFVFSFICKC
jgi:hypothetical protein